MMKMTKYEKITMIVSAIALFISIGQATLGVFTYWNEKQKDAYRNTEAFCKNSAELFSAIRWIPLMRITRTYVDKYDKNPRSNLEYLISNEMDKMLSIDEKKEFIAITKNYIAELERTSIHLDKRYQQMLANLSHDLMMSIEAFSMSNLSWDLFFAKTRYIEELDFMTKEENIFNSICRRV
jgi:hypothetical protein